MITFTVEPTLGIYDDLLKWTVVGDKEHHQVWIAKGENIQERKNRIVRNTIRRVAGELYAQRLNTYRAVGHKREETALSCNILEQYLPQWEYANNDYVFYRMFSLMILPHLKALTPPQDSRFKNYRIRLEALESFGLKCWEYHKKREEAAIKQRVDNQRIMFLNSEAAGEIVTP